MANAVLQGRHSLLECLEERALLSVGGSLLDGAAPQSGQYLTGGLGLSAEDSTWAKENMVVTQDVRLNELAVERLNAERVANGLAPITSVNSVALGEEILGATQAELDAAGESSTLLGRGGAPAGALPTSVDNSTLKYFPPVGNQPYGDCGAWSSTYYTATYMTALARDLDVASAPDQYVLSPRWTYTLANGGEDGGTYLDDCYQVLTDYGAPLKTKYEYTGNSDPTDYLAWVYNDPSVWRDAVGRRMDSVGYVTGVDGNAGLTQLKTLLADGYVLNYHTDAYAWHFTTISNDPSTSADNAYVGLGAIYWSETQALTGYHFMTVVGYNDDIWVDVNRNGTVDSGEKGAVRVANSWGTDWEDGGFTWIAYDALKTTSAVSNGPSSAARRPTWSSAAAFWMQAKASYTPSLLAQYTVKHAERGQLEMSAGIASGITATQPTSTWSPLEGQYMAWVMGTGIGGPYGFDGKDYSSRPASAPSGTFVIDLTDLLNVSNPDVDPVGNNTYFLGLNDMTDATLSGTVTAFSLTDAQGNVLVTCPTGSALGNVPQTDSTGSTSVAYAFVHVPPSPNTTITGTVWNDANNNGVHDFSEAVLSGWQVYADSNNNGVYNSGEAAATTDANGVYSFSVLAGTYTIREVVQSGWVPTAPASGSRVVTGDGGRIVRGNDFGNLQGATISGKVWNDKDTDGTQGTGEPSLSGWTLFLDADFDGVLDTGEKSVTSDTNGNYSFTSLLPGIYEVREVLKAGWEYTTPSFGYHMMYLSAGETYTGNFGNNLPSGVSGTVWEDVNGDGRRDTGEAGLAYWQVYLDVDKDGTWDANEPWDLSDTQGVYSIKNPVVPDGDYYLREVLQTNWDRTLPVDFYVVKIAAGTAVMDKNFGNQKKSGTITGRIWDDTANNNHVWDDADSDGVYDPGDEPLLAGRRVYLDVNDNGTWDVGEKSTLTDSNGAYSLSAYPGTYVLREYQPGDFLPSFPTGGYYSISVPSNGTVSSKDFGNVTPVTISGTVWNDSNADGTYDALLESTTLASNWIVYWDANGNGTRDSGEVFDEIDDKGFYELKVLPESGIVRQDLASQTGWVCTFPSFTSPPVDGYAIDGADVKSGDSLTNRNFGNYLPGIITGVVWSDEDGDGVQDATEPGLADWLVYVDNNKNGMWDSETETETTRTDASGNYSLTVVQGTYRIAHVVGAGYVTTTPAAGYHTVTVAAGDTADSMDFGDVVGGYVTGTIWNDANADGVRSANEPLLPDWDVYLDLDGDKERDSAEPSARSSAFGVYTFTVAPGTYTVREDLTGHSGWVIAWPADQSYTVTVTHAQTQSGADFGNVQPGSISGTVWEDRDGDGLRDTGDAGRSGWTVYVDMDHDNLCDENEPQAITDTSGDYLITGVIAGTRTVREVLKRNWRATNPVSGSSSAAVKAGDTTTGVDFANRAYGSITGIVWKDVDDNPDTKIGQTGLAGWTVFLRNNNDYIVNGVTKDNSMSTVTDANGYYSFGDLPAGSYTVSEDVQAGWSQTAPVSGSYQEGISVGQLDNRDFVNYNEAPHIVGLPGTATVPEDESMTLDFAVSDRETAADNTRMKVTVTSSDTGLVPATALSLTRSGEQYDLEITPTANKFGATTITVTATDGVNTVVQSFVLTVQSVNDAPILNSSATFALPTLLEDATDNAGVLVRDLIASAGGDPITDADPSASEGIAVVGTDSTQGFWEFSLDNGLNWNNLMWSETAPVSTSKARLLAADSETRIRFVPNADFYGSLSAALTFHAWDQSAGSSDTPADVLAATSDPDTVNSCPFSAASAVASITVTSVNDAPSFNAGLTQLEVAEDSGEISLGWATDIFAGAANESTQVLKFLRISTSDDSMFAVLPAVDSSGTLTFTPAPDVVGTVTVTFQLDDQGGTDNGGQHLSALHTLTITILPVNDKPSFTKGADQTIDEDGGAQAVSGWATNIVAGPSNESDQALTFLVTSSNVSLFSVAPAISADGTLTYTPAANAAGDATVTVRLQDNGGGEDTSDAQTFAITIRPVNDEPSFVGGMNQVVNEDSGAHTVADWATQIFAGTTDESAQDLRFSLVDVTDPGLFSALPAIDKSGTLTYTPAADAAGTATVTVQLDDQGGTDNGGQNLSALHTFTITIRPVNDAPSFTKGADQQVTEDAVVESVSGWATGISAGAANEAGQMLYFLLSTDHPEFFAVQPAIDVSSGELSYQLAANAAGVATVSVWLRDNGGADNGGQDTSPEQTFTITIDPVNDAPSFAKGRDVMVDNTAGLTAISGWATEILAGGSDESDQALTFHVAVSEADAGLFATLPTIDATTGTLTFASQPGATGTVTVAVSLSDDAGGLDTSAEQTFTIRIVNPLGELDMRTLTGLNATGDTLWYSLHTVRAGYLTAEAVDSTAALVLYDGNMEAVATSKLKNGNQRIDVLVGGAGETYYLALSGGDGSVDLRVLNLVQAGSRGLLQVAGTATADTLKIDGATSQITINGVAYNLAPTNISFDGGAGDNTVEVLGTSADDQMLFNTATGVMTLNRLTASFATAHLRQFSFDGLAGKNSATLIGTADSDLVTLDSSAGQLVAGTLRAKVTRTATISAYGGGGRDVANLYGTASADFLRMSPNSAGLADSAGTYSFTVNAFSTIVSDGRSGTDQATMYDSAGNDTFIGSTVYSRMYATSGAYSNRVYGYENVNAYASGGYDVAWLYDSLRNDVFLSTPAESTMTGTNFSYRARAFDYVHGIASEGYDKATLYDSAGNDSFTGTPTQGTMQGSGYVNQAKGFDYVLAYASSGTDKAYLYDSSGVDTLQADSSWVRLAGVSPTSYSLYASGFDRVYAYSNDTTAQNVKKIGSNLAANMLFMLGAW